MVQRLTCPQGHAWEIEESTPVLQVHCPVCGTVPDTLEGHGPRADGAADESASTPATLPDLAYPPRMTSWPAIPGCEVLEELGRGGAGVVCKARQPNLNRLVAVKMLVSGAIAGGAERQRFQEEARAAAQLQHPNIVRIYQVGEVEDRPYLVMEYLAGGPLSALAGGKPQSARWSAELMRTLARAVQFAHEHGILHRDLKPGNVLLEHDGTPKVADFGLAKRLDTAELGRGTDGEAPNLTRTGDILGTPSYMAPEQAEGKREVGPAADIWALGVILYELLTGRLPFRGLSAVETILKVMGEEPVPPRRLEPAVPRDLETICLKCLEKKPRGRYGTAAELGDDLDRFLVGEPIRARPVGRMGRAIKWARRRPAQALLLTVSALALTALVGGLTWHERQLTDKNQQLAGALDATEKQRQRNVNLLRLALQVIDEHGDFADEQLKSLPHTERVRRQLLEQRLRYYDPILAQEPGDPSMRQTQGVAYLALGIIKQRLRRYAEAEEAYRQARSRFEQGESEDPTPTHRFDLARVLVQEGTLKQAMSRHEEAEDSLRRGRRMLEQLVAEDSEPSYRRALGVASNNLAHFLDGQKRFEPAREMYQQVITLRRHLADENPDDDRFLWDLLVSHNNLGALYLGRYIAADALAANAAARKEAEELAKKTRNAFEEVRAVLRKLAPRHADGVEYRFVLAGLYLNFGILDRERAPREALKAYQNAVALWAKLHADFPAVPEYTQKAADACGQVGLLLESTGQLSQARDAWRQSLELSEQHERQSPEDPTGAANVNHALYYLAGVLIKSGQWREGERLLQRYVGRLRSLVARSPSPRPRRDLALGLNRLADLYKTKGEALRRIPLPALAVQSHDLGLAVHELARRYAWQGLLGQAADYYNECMEQMRQAAKTDANRLPYYYSLGNQCMSLAAVALLLDSYPDMVRAADVAEESARAITPSNPAGGIRYLLAALYQGRCAAMSSRGDRARSHAQHGLRLLTLAVNAGYRDAAQLEKLSELEPVRRLCAADFAKLLADLRTKVRGDARR
jgi:tetratricopeptide (TPR) repeat protein/tRNA A-37 threonylcarbamoyl transferase component Bud32